MAKIAGYILKQYVDLGDEWLNAVDPWVEGPFSMHRQCAWEDEGLRMVLSGELEIVSKIPLEEADKHICSLCREKLSSPAYFAFEEKYKRLHETIGWIQTISHEEMYSPDGYRDVVDATLIVCRDCESTRPHGYECLERMENKDNWRCGTCDKPMILVGKKSMKEARNGACCLIQLFDFTDQFAPGYYVVVTGDFLGERKHKMMYELHELADAEALYNALLKVSA